MFSVHWLHDAGLVVFSAAAPVHTFCFLNILQEQESDLLTTIEISASQVAHGLTIDYINGLKLTTKWFNSHPFGENCV